MNHTPEEFHYTYCAKQQDEIKAIRKKYAPIEAREDKLAQLRRLDHSVSQKATIYSLAIGIIGALILGFGMSLIMSNLSKILGSYESLAMPLGIIFGLIGIVSCCIAYPLYSHITKKEREKVAPEILRLSDELLQ